MKSLNFFLKSSTFLLFFLIIFSPKADAFAFSDYMNGLISKTGFGNFFGGNIFGVERRFGSFNNVNNQQVTSESDSSTEIVNESSSNVLNLPISEVESGEDSTGGSEELQEILGSRNQSVLSRLLDSITGGNTASGNRNNNANANSNSNSRTEGERLTAEQQKYFNETGKILDKNIIDQKDIRTNFTTPQSVEEYYRNYYASNPNVNFEDNDNPSVWNGDPRTRPNPNQSNSPVNMSPSNFSGKADANADSVRSLADGRFTGDSQSVAEGWLTTKATNFGLTVNGGLDTGLVNFASGCPTAMSGFSASGPVQVCNKHTCVVSLPPDVMDYYWGKTNWGPSRINKWTLPGPLPFTHERIGDLYRKIAGTPIEIINTDNGRCTVAPLWEVGPSKHECQRGKCGLDLTYCVKVVLLDSKKGLTNVKYRPLPRAAKPCEGYQYIEAPVNTPRSRNTNAQS